MDIVFFNKKASILILACMGIVLAANAQVPLPTTALKTARPTGSQWTHVIQVTNPGTRSEGLRENLLYDGVEVPGALDQLQALGYLWVYSPFTTAWTPWGWHIAGQALELIEGDGPVTESELREGMIEVEEKTRLLGVPSTWVLAVHQNECWWVEPGRIAELVRIRGWVRGNSLTLPNK